MHSHSFGLRVPIASCSRLIRVSYGMNYFGSSACCLGRGKLPPMVPSGSSNAIGRRRIPYRAELRYHHPSQRTSRTWTSYSMGEPVSLIRRSSQVPSILARLLPGMARRVYVSAPPTSRWPMQCYSR